MLSLKGSGFTPAFSDILVIPGIVILLLLEVVILWALLFINSYCMLAAHIANNW